MANQNSSGRIPNGWILKNEVQKDGSKFSNYFCQATGQLFLTYEDLMRYVNYAREARVSIYSPEFKAKKLKQKAGLLPRRKHLLIKKARMKHLTGQSSRSLAVKRSKVLSATRKSLSGQSSKLSAVDQGKDINDLAKSTGPADSADLGESAKADCPPHQAGVEAEQVPNLQSGDPVSAL